MAEKIKDSVSFEIANTTRKFQRLADDVSRCIDSQLQNKSLICDACSESFLNLSRFYDNLNEKFSGKMCMDILDTVRKLDQIANFIRS